MQWTAVVALAASLAGCVTQRGVVDEGATRSGSVGMREISHAVAPAARIALADNESFLVPLEDDANAMPAYPEGLLAKQLPPQPVCLRVSIDRDGTVMSAAPLASPPDCPALESVESAFVDATSRVVAGWRYEPALRCVFPDAKTRQETFGSCGGYTEIPEAVTLTYRFVFEQKDGRGAVRML